MAPPEPAPYRPLMAVAEGTPEVSHVELRGLLWAYVAVLAALLLALQASGS
jgi:hypothetical protein